MSVKAAKNEITLYSKARFIHSWYKEWLTRNIEPEEDVMKTIDLHKPEGRFELIILARLFNNYILEDKAIEYFHMFKRWFLQKGFNYKINQETTGVIDFNILKDTSHEINREFGRFIIINCPKTKTFDPEKNYADFVANAMAFSQEDLLHHINETNDGKDLLDVITYKLKGIKVKSFLIVREMHKAGLWNITKENLWMCCVSDSKVRNYLNDNGFVPKEHRIEKRQTAYTLAQLKEYSKTIWKFFNEPFEEKYFDLAIFRYLKEAGKA